LCLYLYISSIYLVLAGGLVLFMNSKVYISFKPSISGLRPSIHVSASICLFMCASRKILGQGYL
jgi:hypothetical protein